MSYLIKMKNTKTIVALVCILSPVYALALDPKYSLEAHQIKYSEAFKALGDITRNIDKSEEAGSIMFHDDGTISQRYGDITYSSDGTKCMQVGDTYKCG